MNKFKLFNGHGFENILFFMILNICRVFYFISSLQVLVELNNKNIFKSRD